MPSQYCLIIYRAVIDNSTMDDKETLNRRARLRELIATCFDGKDAALLDHIQKRTGKRPNQGELSGLQKDHGARSFGDKKAKTLTEQIGLHRRWFEFGPGENIEQIHWMAEEIWKDEEDGLAMFGDATFRTVAAEDVAEYVGRAPKPHMIAVTGLAQLGENGWYEEVSAPGVEGYVEAISSDPDAYVLRVKGDSMHPAIRNGWYVVVEPSRQPCAGEYAAILLHDGRRMVKEFLFQSQSGVSLESVNGGERLTISNEEIKNMHAIGAVLLPSKHRDV